MSFIIIKSDSTGLVQCTSTLVTVQMALVYTELATGKWQMAMEPAGQLLVPAAPSVQCRNDDPESAINTKC